MQSANGGHDGRYLPAGMDYTGMAHHPHHPHHHLSSDPHSGLHYSLPPGAMNSATGLQPHQLGSKRLADMDMIGGNGSSDEDGSMDIKPSLSERGGGTGRGAPLKSGADGPPTGKKTKGRVKIKMEFIDNKLRRYTTFSKRKTGIMKKVKESNTAKNFQSVKTSLNPIFNLDSLFNSMSQHYRYIPGVHNWIAGFKTGRLSKRSSSLRTVFYS